MDDSGCQQQTKEPDDKENDRSSSTRKKISNNSNRSCQKKSKAAGGKSVDKNTAVLSTTTEQRKNVLELGLPMDNMNLGSSSQKQSMVQQDSLGKQQMKAANKMGSTKLLEAEKQEKVAEHHFLLNKDPSTILLSRVSRTALGTVGSVGDFYNSNTDSLLELNQQNLHVPKAYKTETIQGKNTTKCTIGRSTADMDSLFEQLGVGAEQKASIIVGLTTVAGYGDILNIKPAEVGDDSCQFTIFQRIETKKVSVNLSDPEGAQLLLNPARIDQFKGATHIVQSVHYGCVIASVFTILPGRKEFVDLDRVQQIIHKCLKDNCRKKADWAYLKSVQDHFSVLVFANEPFPATLDFDSTPELIKLLEKIQMKTLLAHLKSRVGGPSPFEHPLAYELLPLAQLVQPTFLEAIGNNKSDTELAATQILVDEFVKKWQATVQQHHRILKLLQRIRLFDYCLPETTFTQLTDLIIQLCTQFEELKAGCGQLVKQIRCGMKKKKKRRPSETAQFDRKMQAFLEAVKTLETGIQRQEWRLQNALWMKENGIPFLGRNDTKLQTELDAITRSNTSNSPAICYIFFYFEGNEPTNADHCQLFRKLIVAGEKGIFVDADLIDRQLRRHLRGICVLAKFRDGVQQAFPAAADSQQDREDYFWEYNRKQNTCIARPKKGTPIVPGGSQPTTLIPLKVPCPKQNGHCPNEDCSWECDKCGGTIMFDINTTSEGLDYFYCGCGRAPAFEFEFRCKNAGQHGEHFVAYPLQSLASQLKKLCTGGNSGPTTQPI